MELQRAGEGITVDQPVPLKRMTAPRLIDAQMSLGPLPHNSPTSGWRFWTMDQLVPFQWYVRPEPPTQTSDPVPQIVLNSSLTPGMARKVQPRPSQCKIVAPVLTAHTSSGAAAHSAVNVAPVGRGYCQHQPLSSQRPVSGSGPIASPSVGRASPPSTMAGGPSPDAAEPPTPPSVPPFPGPP